jgi:hypothetical protein
MTKAESKKLDSRISRIYGQVCNGVQIDIMAIGKVMQVGRNAAIAGGDDAHVGAAIASYVETIREN